MGMVSVAFIPCHLASIPLIVSYVAGQEKALKANHAAYYAVAFTVGLFITVKIANVPSGSSLETPITFQTDLDPQAKEEIQVRLINQGK